MSQMSQGVRTGIRSRLIAQAIEDQWSEDDINEQLDTRSLDRVGRGRQPADESPISGIVRLVLDYSDDELESLAKEEEI